MPDEITRAVRLQPRTIHPCDSGQPHGHFANNDTGNREKFRQVLAQAVEGRTGGTSPDEAWRDALGGAAKRLEDAAHNLAVQLCITVVLEEIRDPIFASRVRTRLEECARKEQKP